MAHFMNLIFKPTVPRGLVYIKLRNVWFNVDNWRTINEIYFLQCAAIQPPIVQGRLVGRAIGLQIPHELQYQEKVQYASLYIEPHVGEIEHRCAKTHRDGANHRRIVHKFQYALEFFIHRPWAEWVCLEPF